MKRNETLQKDVQDAIKWEPLLNAAEIGVTAKDGIVTLSGVVDSYAKKSEAEYATKNVTGVRAIVENITIKFDTTGQKDDADIAKDVVNALGWSWAVPKDRVQVKVEEGWVTLEGELFWNYEKQAAQKAIKDIVGITGVTNGIKIKSETHDEIEKKNIENALIRNWSVDNQDIIVNVLGNTVTLTGTVRSLYQKDEAERMAWNAPGVWTVNNELTVEYNDD
ncbi:BON domain-containing protein [Flectobacillus major]|uniref:BON domain-containing protein n=1 Tax=Flectobacillus major TaxID=103 RepID=UPI000422E920|nr:BON domain-containing protein [Flectobacillus major]